MNIDQTQTPEPQNQTTTTIKTKKHLSPITAVLSVIIALLIGLITWGVWWYYSQPAGEPQYQNPNPTQVANGPCFDGAENTLPEGYTWYENSTLGYKFAYPTAWGAVSITTTPIASETGKYVQGKFASSNDVVFGGNATNYTVMGRGGAPLDLPGYLQASDKFYTVEIWKYNDGSGAAAEARDDLHLIEGAVQLKDGCNTKAAVNTTLASEMNQKPFDTARFNLQPTNEYYGVNFVLNDPNAAKRADFDKIIKSFQLLDL